MNTPNQHIRSAAPLLFTLAAIVGVTTGACKNDGGESDVSSDVEDACADYCTQAKVCKDEISQDVCKKDCANMMKNCQADEQDEALDQLDGCASESCDDFIGCSINVGSRCFFGI